MHTRQRMLRFHQGKRLRQQRLRSRIFHKDYLAVFP